MNHTCWLVYWAFYCWMINPTRSIITSFGISCIIVVHIILSQQIFLGIMQFVLFENKTIDVKLKLGCSHIKLASLQKWIKIEYDTFWKHRKEREQRDSLLCCSLCEFLPIIQTKYKQHVTSVSWTFQYLMMGWDRRHHPQSYISAS